MRAVLVSLLLAGCGASAPHGTTEPTETDVNALFATGRWGGCSQVFTEGDAKALQAAEGRLVPAGACSFEGVFARGSEAALAFRTKDGRRAAAVLRPRSCVSEPSGDAIVADPYVLVLAEGASAMCPDQLAALVKAAQEGRLPPPSQAR